MQLLHVLTLTNHRFCNTSQLTLVPIFMSETPLDEAHAVLLERFKSRNVGARRNLEYFGNPVSDFCFRKRSQKRGVDNGVKRFMVAT